MKKVLIVGINALYGGIEFFCKELIMHKPDDYKIDCLVFDNDIPIFEDENLRKMVTVHTIIPKNGNMKHGLKDFLIRRKDKRVDELLKNEKYDIIHFNITKYCMSDLIIKGYKYGSKIILHSHAADIKTFKNRIKHILNKWFINIKRIPYYKLACGEDAGKFMFKKGYTIINNGIDVARFRYNLDARNKIRKELNIDDSTFLMGNVARFSIQKNLSFLIDIFSEYKKINNNSKLIILGDGNLRNELEDKIKSMNLENDVLLVGNKTNANEYYSALDTFVMPSLWEGLSIAIIEAQTNGLKCFTSTNVDLDSNATENVTFISLDESPKEWAKVINENNQRDIDAYKKLPDKFNIEKSAKKVFEFYDSII